MRFRRGDLDEGEHICAAAAQIVADTESRVSQLWLGPLYIEVLLALSERAQAGGNSDEAAAKRKQGAERLMQYQQLVAECQSPRFRNEAARLTDKLGLGL